MIDFIEYAEAHTTAESELLQKINRETHLYVMHPRMLSGVIKGSLLRFISRMIRPQRNLEIGTYTGYSALCLAEGLQEQGELITIEHDPELEDRACGYFREAGKDGQIKMLMGEGIEVLNTVEGPFDLAFIDADKRDYPELYERVMEKVCPGGFILADNVLWGGKVLKDAPDADQDTNGMKRFNDRVQKDERAENVMLPFQDGLMLIRKK